MPPKQDLAQQAKGCIVRGSVCLHIDDNESPCSCILSMSIMLAFRSWDLSRTLKLWDRIAVLIIYIFVMQSCSSICTVLFKEWMSCLHKWLSIPLQGLSLIILNQSHLVIFNYIGEPDIGVGRKLCVTLGLRSLSMIVINFLKTLLTM